MNPDATLACNVCEATFDRGVLEVPGGHLPYLIRLRSLLRLPLIAIASLVLTSCGGGGSTTSNGAAGTLDSEPSLVQALSVGKTTNPAIDVTKLVKVTERRLARTIWEYVFRLEVTNSGSSTQGVRLTLTGVPEGSVIVDGLVALGDIGANSTVSPADTITIQQDRLVALDLSKFSWLAESSGPLASVTVDASVPPSTRAAIAEFVTPAGDAASPSAIPLPSMPNGAESMILALDSAGDIRLAALTRSTAVSLSVDSTAIALVRLMIGATAPKGGGLAGDTAIRSAPAFSDLESTLAIALAAGTAPQNSQAVVNALAVVASQALTFVPHTQSSASSRARPLSLGSPRVTTDFPYTLLHWPSFPEPISVIIAKLTGGQLDLVNSMTIAWAVQAMDINGSALSTEVVLPPNDLLAILSGLVRPEDSSEIMHKVLAASGSGAFNLKLFQSKASVVDTGASVASRILATALKFVPATTCDSAHLKIDLALAFNLIYNRNDSALQTLEKQLNVSNLTRLAASCAPRLVADGKKFLPAVSKFFNFIRPINVAVSSYLIPAQIALAIQFYNEERTFGVCKVNGAIVNCASRFAFTPATVAVIPGIVISPTGLKAFDAVGMETVIPNGITYTADPGTILDQPGPTGGTLARFPGSSAIHVTDLVTGATGRLAVSVVRPTLSPASPTLQVGDFLAVRLVDSTGTTLTAVDGSTWTSSNAAVLGSNGTGGFLALSAGTATISFRNKFNGEVVSTTALVEESTSACERKEIVAGLWISLTCYYDSSSPRRIRYIEELYGPESFTIYSATGGTSTRYRSTVTVYENSVANPRIKLSSGTWFDDGEVHQISKYIMTPGVESKGSGAMSRRGWYLSDNQQKIPPSADHINFHPNGNWAMRQELLCHSPFEETDPLNPNYRYTAFYDLGGAQTSNTYEVLTDKSLCPTVTSVSAVNDIDNRGYPLFRRLISGQVP